MQKVHSTENAIPITGDNQVSDDRLRRAADMALRDCGYANVAGLDVSVVGGHITLSGTVPSFYMKQLAQVAIMKLDGARRVENRVIVEHT